MTKQPSKVRDALARLKAAGLTLPEERNPNQCWLLVVMHPQDGSKGEVFLTHARNFTKFHNRKGFEVVGHGFDKEALQNAQRRLTLRLGEGYQPKFSAHLQARTKPQVEAGTEEVPEAPSEQPDDLVDFVTPDKPAD